MEKILIDGQFDYIFLLAAVASVADTITRPLITHEINQNANLFILETIRTKKLTPKKVLFSSSAAVYGNNPVLPKKENSPIDPLSPYAIDKYATERFVIDYGKLYNIATVCTRFFNVYGPKQNPKSPYSGVLSLIERAFKTDNTFTIFGDGQQSRDFVYIEDVIRALIMLATSTAEHDVFNVATGSAVPLMDVFSEFEQAFNKQIKINFADERKGDIKHSVASIDKLKGLGYKPQFDINTGIEKYLRWDEING